MDEVPLSWAERPELLRYQRWEIEARWQQRWADDGTHPHWLASLEPHPYHDPNQHDPARRRALHQGHVRQATMTDVSRRYLAVRDGRLPSPIELPRLGALRLAGTRMSHRRGNVVGLQPTLDDIGLDTLRLAYLQAKHPGQHVDWEALSFTGCRRFLERVWRLARTDRADIARLRTGPRTTSDADIEDHTRRFVIAATEAYQRHAYNRAVARYMAFVNSLYPYAVSDEGPHDEVLTAGIDSLLVTLAPAAPHITAEIWSIRHHGVTIDATPWPTGGPPPRAPEAVTMVIQIDGRRRARLDVAPDLPAAAAEALALADEGIQTRLAGISPTRVIVRSPHLVNIVTKPHAARFSDE